MRFWLGRVIVCKASRKGGPKVYEPEDRVPEIRLQPLGILDGAQRQQKSLFDELANGAHGEWSDWLTQKVRQ